MAGKINFTGACKDALGQMSLTAAKLETGLEKIDAEGGKISLEIYRADKIEKMVFSSIEVYEMSVSEESAIIWPENGYDFPVLWCNLTSMPGLNIAIFDFIPLMDIVVWPRYLEIYLKNLQEAKKRSLDILGKTVIEKDFELSSVIVRCLSPYRALLKLTDEGVSCLPEVIKDYCSLYMGLWQKAGLPVGSEEKKFCKQKKEAIRKLMKENDPGYPVMEKIFGEGKTKKVFDIVF